jgi:hypothetical protein
MEALGLLTLGITWWLRGLIGKHDVLDQKGMKKKIREVGLGAG